MVVPSARSSGQPWICTVCSQLHRPAPPAVCLQSLEICSHVSPEANVTGTDTARSSKWTAYHACPAGSSNICWPYRSARTQAQASPAPCSSPVSLEIPYRNAANRHPSPSIALLTSGCWSTARSCWLGAATLRSRPSQKEAPQGAASDVGGKQYVCTGLALLSNAINLRLKLLSCGLAHMRCGAGTFLWYTSSSIHASHAR